ncbi:hypothetical protein P3T24_003272 [Paraburkholderia sp. GAS33]|jgi:hypothetical protein
MVDADRFLFETEFIGAGLGLLDPLDLNYMPDKSGRRLRTGLTLSSSEARCRSVDSAIHGETSCTPIGSLDK